MPARSKAQRRAMAIAAHAPDELYERNAGLRKMSKKELHDFASTSESGLPQTVRKRRKKRKWSDRMA